MAWTKEEKRQYMRDYYARRKQYIIALIGDSCTACGLIDNLEIDHVDWRTKLFNVSKIWSIKDQDALTAEIKKCQLLCTKCHKIKTAKDLSEQNTKEINHGTIYAWMKRKCGCNICEVSKRSWYDKRNKGLRDGKAGPRKPYGRKTNHGEKLNYTRGCRCSLCKKANAEYAKSLRNKQV